MNISLTTYIIACLFVFLAGFVDAIAGGGGLISIPGYLIAGLPPVVASATNKLSAGMGATVSLTYYVKNKFVDFKLAIPCMIIAIMFSSIGARLQMMVPERMLKIFMLVALPLTLIIVLNKDAFKNKKVYREIKLTKKVYLLSFTISAILGIYDGIYGPATGTFLLIFFTKIVGMDIKESNGISKSINFATNMGALSLFLFSGKVLLTLGIVAGLCNMLGNFVGANLFVKKGVSVARPIMIIVMVIFIIRIVVDLLT